MKHRFVEEALDEFIAAARYYNRQVPGLGDAFVDEVEAGIQTVMDDPKVWRVVEDDVRRYLIHRFPYGLYYSIDGDIVVIWAVKHLHRDPDYWQHRRE
ncbi:MAG TPA: type II toxin-antitoxin system RelE/ParE family toxin [Verrucomicrobiae bacterium]|jgi:plasmid stabilization system protein ParE|nr:type II toxin-antitoxin system RelE/ParE family toxin [Verrucomicrobiae bacterium]